MTKEEVIALMQSDTPLNRARKIFSNAWATLENSQQQRKPMTIFEIREMEFETVRKIVREFEIELHA